jgi:hypothetical protein
MTKSRGLLPPREFWPPHHIEILGRFYADLRTQDIADLLGKSISRVYAKAHELGLKKSAEYQASVHSGRVQRGQQDPRMLGTRFQKGLVPWNKGLKGLSYEGGKATQFKKGEMNGTAKLLYVPIGSYRISADGHLEQKLTDDPAIAPAQRWTPVSRLVWERDNGPIPAGRIVVFKRGQKTAVLDLITVDRLDCITRAEHVRRNHWTNLHPELAAVVPLKGAITRQVNRINRAAREAEESRAS